MVFIIAFLLAPYAVMTIIGVLAATHANVAFWLAEHGIHTDTCPSPETIARREAEAKAQKRAERAEMLADWIGQVRKNIEHWDIKRQQATDDAARWEAEDNFCWALGQEQYYVEMQTGKVINDGSWLYNYRINENRNTILWERFHRRYGESPRERAEGDQKVEDVTLELMSVGISQKEASAAALDQVIHNPKASGDQLVRNYLETH